MPNRPITLSGTLNGLLMFIVLFPFVPSIIPATDTQPSFLGVFALSLLLGTAIPSVFGNAYRLSWSTVNVIAGAALVIYLCLVTASVFQGQATLVARVVSFVQFLAAMIWAYAAKVRWNVRTFYLAILVYAVFTVVYFATGGVIEDVLIRSRAQGGAALFALGRGARTLAPEPAFFALQVFNIFVLSRLLGAERQLRKGAALTYVTLTVLCLAASFSGYGALLLMVVIACWYPKASVLFVTALVLAVGFAANRFPEWESVRAIKVVLTLVQSHGSLAQLVILDPSIASRLSSFMEYVGSLARHPVVGDGFSVYQGGGFISILAALGTVAIFFFAELVRRIITGDHRLSTKALLLVWLATNVVSGPVGVPILGVIAGTVLRARGRPLAQAEPPRPAVPDPLLTTR